MIYFLADDHYGMHPGAVLNEALHDRYSFSFFENDLSCLTTPEFSKDCELLILNLIGSTCNMEPAGKEAERCLRVYLEQGKPLLLLHGASAAFWHWDWWRHIVGYRWVRSNDPDGVKASSHPTRAYRVDIAKIRHPLCRVLQPMDCPEDEIYIHLEQTCPTMVLLETTITEGTFPQCWECTTPWGGRLIGFLPGHRREVVGNKTTVANASILIDSLLLCPSSESYKAR